MKFQHSEGNRICKTFKDDCVIRSISIAMNKPYGKVFADLMQIGMEMGAYPSHDKVWQSYLESNGWLKNKPPRDSRGKLIKLRDWQGVKTAVVINSGHLTAISDNKVCDEWDCTYRPTNSYWTPPTN